MNGGIVLNPIVGLPEPLVLGLHALGQLAQNPDRCMTTQQIAAALGTAEPHLSKVLQRLNKGGFVKSLRGPGCGLEGCKGHHCFIADMLDELTRALIRYLESRTLADFTEYYNGRIPVEIEISVITPSLGQKHPNFGHLNLK